MKKQKLLLYIALICGCAILLSGCAAAYSAYQYTPGRVKEGGGLFKGLLDGYVAIFYLIGSAFTSKAIVYEAKNIGFWYDFGFIIGFLLFLASLSTDDGGGGDKKQKDQTPPDPGKPEDQPRKGKRFPRRIGIRGTDVKVTVYPWKN